MNDEASFSRPDIDDDQLDSPGDSRRASMPQHSNHPLSKEIQDTDAGQNPNFQSSFPLAASAVASSSNVKLPNTKTNFGRPPIWHSTPYPTPKSTYPSTFSETQNSSSCSQPSSHPIGQNTSSQKSSQNKNLAPEKDTPERQNETSTQNKNSDPPSGQYAPQVTIPEHQKDQQTQDSRPPGQNSGNSRPLGQNSGNSRPPGQNSGNSRPPAQNSGNSRPPGQNSGDSRPTGQNSGDSRPPGQNSGNDPNQENSDNKDYAADSRAQQNAGIRRKESASAKKTTQKERMKEICGSLPNGTETMTNIVHTHTQLLLGLNGADLASLPPDITNEERNLAVQRGKNLAYDQPPPTAPESQSNHTHAFRSWIQTQLRDLGLTRFNFDWGSSWKHPCNKLMDLLFY
ncbi:hypothetical protein PCASD_26368 [Puccinia coronata f. sp. avenae]|uniref:Uncharacterized protein n=1 Tax=Puccinia coronata f. sp. avenae TaxID=200324 RepID=A0A2N5TKM7_9BASI|nr:hypothetical protein PCASD_26368 [Puccinia coronata f. sp. avenae]